MESSHGNKAVAAIVALALGLAVGGGVGYATASNMNNGEQSDNSSMQMDSGSDGVTVGGAKMVKDRDIVDNAMNADNVTTVVDLVGKADLVDTLKGEGPFTVFAPNNAAFEKLPAETVQSLQQPENKDQLAGILTYHVVPGTYTTADLRVMAREGEGIETVQGEMIMPVVQDGDLMIEDANGDMVMIETSDVISSNGVTHVIESVLMPRS